MLPKCLNQNAEIWLSTAPLCGIGSGRITSKAEIRSVTTNNSVSPRSKTSRTLPLRSFLIPGRSIEDCVAICIFNAKRPTPNAQRPMDFCVERWTLDLERSTLNSFYARNCGQTAGANIARTRLGFFERSPEGLWETGGRRRHFA